MTYDEFKQAMDDQKPQEAQCENWKDYMDRYLREMEERVTKADEVFMDEQMGTSGKTRGQHYSDYELWAKSKGLKIHDPTAGIEAAAELANKALLFKVGFSPERIDELLGRSTP